MKKGKGRGTFRNAPEGNGQTQDGTKTKTGKTRSEAIERTLLLLLVKCIHPLLQLSPRSLRLTTSTPLLLNSLQRHTLRVSLLAQRSQLVLHLDRLLLPRVAVRLDLVALRLKVAKGFFQGGGELFLGVQVFFDGLDAGFLVFD